MATALSGSEDLYLVKWARPRGAILRMTLIQESCLDRGYGNEKAAVGGHIDRCPSAIPVKSTIPKYDQCNILSGNVRIPSNLVYLMGGTTTVGELLGSGSPLILYG